MFPPIRAPPHHICLHHQFSYIQCDKQRHQQRQQERRQGSNTSRQLYPTVVAAAFYPALWGPKSGKAGRQRQRCEAMDEWTSNSPSRHASEPGSWLWGANGASKSHICLCGRPFLSFLSPLRSPRAQQHTFGGCRRVSDHTHTCMSSSCWAHFWQLLPQNRKLFNVAHAGEDAIFNVKRLALICFMKPCLTGISWHTSVWISVVSYP